MKILQKGFNFSQDGPGNRLVYHLQGCNFRCKWCSNPESMSAADSDAKNYTVDELFDEAKRSRMMFFDGGGVTFTGGECTLQHEELKELLKRLREAGISTAIETNASSPYLPEIAEHVDYLIADFKHYDSEIHKKWTGAGNEAVRQNLAELFASGRQLHIRIPLIRGVNDSPQGFVDFFTQHNTSNAVFEFLPYHEFGKDKWTAEYEIENGFVTDETVKEFKNLFVANGLTVVTT
ncbi:MAG: radical SAM protein [Clostridia bacterium]|nr:radical SAM protein [Clostridia bacterium]